MSEFQKGTVMLIKCRISKLCLPEEKERPLRIPQV